MGVLRCALIGLLVSATGSVAAAQTFDAADFFGRTEVGDFLQYRLNGTTPVELRVVGTELLDGVETYVSRWSGGPLDGLESNVSYRPAVGAELWLNFQTDLFLDGIGFVDFIQIFDPPLKVGLPTITIGESVVSEGPFTQAFFNDVGSLVQPGFARSEYRYAFEERIAVPFGDFDAVQRQIQIDLRIEVEPGRFEDVRATSRDWVVRGLGSVRIEQTFPDRTDVYVLEDTNRIPLPEPGAPGGSTIAILVLAWLSHGVRRRTPPASPVAQRRGATSQPADYA